MLSSIFRRDDCAKEYKIGDELGRGSFAIVRKGISRKDNSAWAIKCIDKLKLDEEDEAALEIEVEILEKVNHPNIVRLRQVFDTPKVFYMVMELMTGGELFDRIVQKSKYGEAEAATLIRKLADALAYCHSRGIVHRDLKPENLLYTDETDNAEIKIADFGLAKLLNQSQIMATACGTPGYVAPEILDGKPYTEKVDCWSLGVIAYIILCGFPPFYDENNAALFAQIKAASYDFPSPYWDGVSNGAKDLIRKLLVLDPTKRLSAADILKHNWVVNGGSGGATTLDSAFEHLRKYNARRRFRQGVRKVMAANAFARFGKLKLNAGLAPSESAIAVSDTSSSSTTAVEGTTTASTETSSTSIPTTNTLSSNTTTNNEIQQTVVVVPTPTNTSSVPSTSASSQSTTSSSTTSTTVPATTTTVPSTIGPTTTAATKPETAVTPAVSTSAPAATTTSNTTTTTSSASKSTTTSTSKTTPTTTTTSKSATTATTKK